MTLSEFKAWFEGYTESLDGAPTEKQFKRIKAQVAKIDGVSITPVVYRDVYWPRVQPYYERMYASWGGVQPSTAFGTAVSAAGGVSTASAAMLMSRNPDVDKATVAATYSAAMMDDEPAVFNPSIALFAAGKADAQIDA